MSACFPWIILSGIAVTENHMKNKKIYLSRRGNIAPAVTAASLAIGALPEVLNY